MLIKYSDLSYYMDDLGMEALAESKPYRYWLTSITLAFASLCIMPCKPLYADQPTTLSIGWGEWAPYSYIDKNGELRGLEVEIAEAVFDRAGYQLDWKKLPWKRHLVMLENGEIDVASAASWSLERAKYAHFSIPYRPEQVVLLLSSDAAAQYPTFQSSEDVLNSNLRNLGASLGFYYGKEFEALENSLRPKNRLRYFENNERMYGLLLTDRLDGIFVDPNTAFNYYEPLGKVNEVKEALRIFTNNAHMMLSKASVPTNVVADVNQALHSVTADGTIDKIIESHQQFNHASGSEPRRKLASTFANQQLLPKQDRNAYRRDGTD